MPHKIAHISKRSSIIRFE